MRVLICGDRHWDDEELIRDYFKTLPINTVIITGAAPGADTIAENLAREMFTLEPEVYDAEWHRYGRAAGPIRNKRMLDEGKPDLVAAFHNDIENSKGTADMLKQAKKAGVHTELHASHGAD